MNWPVQNSLGYFRSWISIVKLIRTAPRVNGLIGKIGPSTMIIQSQNRIYRGLPGNRNKLFVKDFEGVRSLYFDDRNVQSSMRLSDPSSLELGYTRTMMGFLLFNDNPKNILIVGLGGGSLSKYCYFHFPQALTTTLEINKEVIALRDYFLIPADNERFHVVLTDAADYIGKIDIQADTILLDGFDEEGIPQNLSSEAFYSNCWAALKPDGILVANFAGNKRSAQGYLQLLRLIFKNQVWYSDVSESTNLIAFAVKDQNYSPRWPFLLMRAHLLELRYHLDLPQIVKSIRRNARLNAILR